MKNSYFSTDRGGRLHYQNVALLNGKSICKLKGYNPLYAIIYDPYNNKRTWHWEDNEGNIRSISEHRTYDDIDYIATINDHKIRTKDNMASNHWLAIDYARDRPKILDKTINPHPNKLRSIFFKFFECDFIMHPEVLLGYFGYVKDDKSGLKLYGGLEKDIRNLNINLEYSIEQFKLRRNIIVKKDDIKHWARSWFLGGGDLRSDYESYYQLITCRLNAARKYHHAYKIMLERHDIPYEYFSLDTGDYCKTFDIDKNFNRYETEGTGPLLRSEHEYMLETWIDRYVTENP